MNLQERIEEILKTSELWRHSNYVGRDTGEYSKDKLSGTQRLIQDILKAVEEKLTEAFVQAYTTKVFDDMKEKQSA